MSSGNLPLLKFFLILQKVGLLLGIEEYHQLLRALQGGFGIESKEALRNVCRTLWVKSVDDQHLFEYYFDLIILPSMEDEFSPPFLFEMPSDETFAAPKPPVPSLLEPKTRVHKVPQAAEPAEIFTRVEDELQVVQAALSVARVDYDSHSYPALSSDEYLPVTRHQMKQIWRYLRRPMREGPAVELDIKATSNEVGQHGRFMKPVMMPRRFNHTKLLLLIDRGGSMVPFHVLSQRLLETALRSGRLGEISVYYFHNYPIEYLYHDPHYQRYGTIEHILRECSTAKKRVMILSDCGTARGGFSQDRVERTQRFLQQIKQYFRYSVWVNPVPSSRWNSTTASVIRRSIPMFDFSRRGLENAIKVLRGTPFSFLQEEAEGMHE